MLIPHFMLLSAFNENAVIFAQLLYFCHSLCYFLLQLTQGTLTIKQNM